MLPPTIFVRANRNAGSMRTTSWHRCLDVAAMGAHDLHRIASCRKFSVARVEVQNAFLQIVIAKAERLPQLAKAAARIKPERDNLANVASGACRRALQKKSKAPAPLRRIRAKPNQERRVFIQ
jgi:hypothetical protein